MAAVLYSLLTVAGTVTAQDITNLVYEDNFGRQGVLNGTTPDTADNWYTNSSGASYYTNANADAIWFACDAPVPNQVMMTDGSEIAYTNAPDNGTNGFFMNGWLPFSPQVGHKYIFAVKIYTGPFASQGSQWLAAGFANTPSTNSYWAAGTPQVGVAWLLQRANDANIQTFISGGVGGTVTINMGGQPVTNAYKIILDTTTGNATSGWTVDWYTNGVLARTSTFSTANPTFHAVGLGGDGANGYFQNFSLTDIVVPPTAPNITEQPQNATVSVGQTATFWVNSAEYPLPTYQWMTNSVGGVTNAITGATNSTYTTPLLTLANSGLQYSVAITNSVGSTNSAPATLTVNNTPATVFSAMKATATSPLTSVVVTFSKAVDPTTGLNANNYTLNGVAGTISSVAYGSSASNCVILTTSSNLSTNESYNVTVENVKDLFGNTTATTTVPVLPAGLAIYLRADSGVILDDNGNVAEWMDQTTNGNNAVQNVVGGPGARPSTTNDIGSEPALTFTGSLSNFLQAASSTSLAITNNMSIYAVVNYADFAANREVLSKDINIEPAPYEYYANTTGRQLLLRGEGQNSGAFTSSLGASAGTPHVLAVTMTGVTNGSGTGTVSHYLDGSPNGAGTLTVAAPSDIVDAGHPFWVGGREDLSQWMNGQIGEIMVFNQALSAADMTNVDNYLGTKYFSFAITQNLPATLTSSNGYTVTYTFGASQGSAHFAYQWQENGTNIPGATSSTYTTPVLAPSDNGDTFDVELTLLNGSTIYSVTNTLTVLTAPPVVTAVGMPIWNSNEVVVVYNEAIDPTTATTVGNYSLNGVSISSAAIGNAANKVVLTTSGLAWTGNTSAYSLMVSGVKDLYGNTIVPVSANVGVYPPSVVLWVKADTGVTLDGAQPPAGVYSWNDLSGNGNTLDTVSGIDPLLATNANGNAVIHFTATNQTEMDAVTTPTLAITGDMSYVAAVDLTTLGGANSEILGKTGSGSLANIPAPYDSYVNTTGADFLRGNGGNGGAGVSYGSFGATVAPTVGVPQIIAVSETGNTVSDWVNGEAAGSGVLGNNYQEAYDADQGQDFSIGQRGDEVNRLTGDMAELVVMNAAVSSSDLASLDSYLAAKYKVTLFNPNPTNILFSVSGTNVLLSWPADHTGWQLQAQTNKLSVGLSTNWVNVTTSLTTNQLTIPISTNGSVFYRLAYP